MSYVYPDLGLVCEGEADRIVLAELISRLLLLSSIRRRVQIFVANGKLVIPRMARAVEHRFAHGSLIVVVDSDGKLRSTQKILERSLQAIDCWKVVANPSVVSWVASGAGKVSPEFLAGAASRIDLAQIEVLHPEFAVFVEALRSFPI